MTLLNQTLYGFIWGPLEIERCCSDPKWGVLITLSTDKEKIEIRSTPTGLLRVGKVEKKVEPIDGSDKK